MTKIYEARNIEPDIASKMIELGRNPFLRQELSPYFVSCHDNPGQYSEERIYHLRNFGITLRVESRDDGDLSKDTKKVLVYAYAGDGKVDRLKVGEVERIINETLPIVLSSSRSIHH